MPELIQKLIDLLSYISKWLTVNIGAGFINFIKAVGVLMIRIFEFFIDIIRWFINHI